MKQLRIMTFNIQHCMNYITREIDYPLFAKTIAGSGADIVGLNEVRGESETEGYDDQVRILAEGAGYKYHYFAEAIRFNGRDPYGNALLSKYPIVSAETVHIPDPVIRKYLGYYETRCIGKIKVDVDGTMLTVMSVHFGLNKDEHKNARDTVLKNIGEKPCVLMGDMNVKPHSKILWPIRLHMTDAASKLESKGLSFPSDNPKEKIDYIFVSHDVRVISAEVPPLVVSDHRPHTAVIEI